MLEGMKRSHGFTLIELLVTITVMVVLMTLATANLRSTQVNARDQDRVTDVENIVRTLETLYASGFTFADLTSFKGSYPTTTQMDTITERDQIFVDLPRESRIAAGNTATTDTIVLATNNAQTTAGVTPSPGLSYEYVYQPIDSAGALCITVNDCRKFNLYYRTEVGGTIYMVKSKRQ